MLHNLSPTLLALVAQDILVGCVGGKYSVGSVAMAIAHRASPSHMIIRGMRASDEYASHRRLIRAVCTSPSGTCNDCG
ncbi:MAG: hypothetical protein JRM77_08880 [Nitrososphaerota archaeon]|nr:hypothetical protein [Nitrososphaerota archaeon]